MNTTISNLGNSLIHNSLSFTNDDDTIDTTSQIDIDQHSLLMQRLEDLERVANSFLKPRPCELTTDHDSFCDLWPDHEQLFTLNLSSLINKKRNDINYNNQKQTDNDDDDILCLQIAGTYIDINETNGIITHNSGLEVQLKRNSNDNDDNNDNTGTIIDEPTLHGGCEYMYTININKYIESIQKFSNSNDCHHDDDDLMTIKLTIKNILPISKVITTSATSTASNDDECISVRITTTITTTPSFTILTENDTVYGRVSYDCYNYYSFTH